LIDDAKKITRTNGTEKDLFATFTILHCPSHHA